MSLNLLWKIHSSLLKIFNQKKKKRIVYRSFALLIYLGWQHSKKKNAQRNAYCLENVDFILQVWCRCAPGCGVKGFLIRQTDQRGGDLSTCSNTTTTAFLRSSIGLYTAFPNSISSGPHWTIILIVVLQWTHLRIGN